MKTVRVLVVDDSPTMRGLVTAVLQRDPAIEVVGTAGNPYEARAAIKAINPDVMTLDVEMPGMNGLDFLEKVMRLRPLPVIMISTLTQQGADTSIRALEMGAFDCVGKPLNGMTATDAFADLAEKVKMASRALIRPASQRRGTASHGIEFHPNGRVVAIGSSTGGVEALLTILADYPANCPPTVITQHMPATFTRSFAERLDRSTSARVCEAYEGAPLEQGRVYLAPGGSSHLEITGARSMRCHLRSTPLVNGHCPSVDVLFHSVADIAGPSAVGVILTGMGRDGAQGMLAMSQAGALTLGQNELSCVVFGMPKVAFEIGAVDRQLPLEQIGGEILKLCNADKRESNAIRTVA